MLKAASPCIELCRASAPGRRRDFNKIRGLSSIRKSQANKPEDRHNVFSPVPKRDDKVQNSTEQAAAIPPMSDASGTPFSDW